MTKKGGTAGNGTFAIGRLPNEASLCYADSFVVEESFVLCINVRGKNTAHSKSAKR